MQFSLGLKVVSCGVKLPVLVKKKGSFSKAKGCLYEVFSIYHQKLFYFNMGGKKKKKKSESFKDSISLLSALI